MASLYKLPCIFVVENNLWAIGMNHNRATNPTAGDDAPFIYKKGPAFGMPGVLVDGMDVRKVRSCLCVLETFCLSLAVVHKKCPAFLARQASWSMAWTSQR